MPHYKLCLSNHDPRFLTHGLGLIRLLPTVMEHESNLSSCCRVPTNKNSVLSSLIINRSWTIHFLTASMHFSIACIASAWAVLPCGLKLRYSCVSSGDQRVDTGSSPVYWKISLRWQDSAVVHGSYSAARSSLIEVYSWLVIFANFLHQLPASLHL